MSQTTCRVCGQVYPDSQKSCPRCGCQQGAAIPAYLRCKRCRTVLPSSLCNCPQCGQGISPKTASVVLFRELANGQGGQTEGRTPSGAANSPKTTKSDAPKRAAQPADKRRKTLLWAASIAAVALLLTGETFLVKSIYANVTYRDVSTSGTAAVRWRPTSARPTPFMKAPLRKRPSTR